MNPNPDPFMYSRIHCPVFSHIGPKDLRRLLIEANAGDVSGPLHVRRLVWVWAEQLLFPWLLPLHAITHGVHAVSPSDSVIVRCARRRVLREEPRTHMRHG